jgi:hypothetical protein
MSKPRKPKPPGLAQDPDLSEANNMANSSEERGEAYTRYMNMTGRGQSDDKKRK